MAASNAPSRSQVDGDAFYEWLPDDLDFRVAVRWERGYWYALAEDFDVTGMGETLKEALVDMDGLVRAYLASYFLDGAPFERALRPIPLKLKVQIRLGSAVVRVLERLAGRREHLPLSRERRYLFAPNSANGAAS